MPVRIPDAPRLTGHFLWFLDGMTVLIPTLLGQYGQEIEY